MIFLFIKSIAESFNSHILKGFIVLLGALALIVLIFIMIIKAVRCTRRVLKIFLCMLCVCLAPQVFALMTFVEFMDHGVQLEYVGKMDGEKNYFDDYFVEGERGFTLTNTPPGGTCGWGDIPLEKLPQELGGILKADYQIDCEQYTYLFTRGIRNPKLEYSVWSNGAWYLGPKGFWRSNDDAKLISVDDSGQEDNSIYIFRFPRKYIALRSEPIVTGEVTFFLIKLSW